jgi:hypothetical protein
VTVAVRKRLAESLLVELDLVAKIERAEAVAVGIDRGLGMAACAAVAAMPVGPARAVEARRWVRRAQHLGIEKLVTVIPPNMTDDDFDAMVELHVALAEAA